MIKEIQEISKAMITLNDRVYRAILSTEELHILKSNLTIIESIKNDINHLLEETSFISSTNTEQLITILTKIHQLLSQQAIAVESIATLTDKFIRNYREEWNIIQKNIA